jgi:hypothetical protein
MESPPFVRGGTFYSGGTISTPVSGDYLGGYNYEGMEFEYEDSQLPNGGYGTGLNVRVRVVRNSTGGPVLPGQLVTLNAVQRVLDLATVLPGTNADSIARTTASHAFPADEFLPTAGVPNGDLFYVVVAGPCLVKSAATGTPTVSVDGKMVGGTMAGTTSVDAGGVVVQDTSGATTALANQIQNAIGRAMSALTSGQTSTPVLVNIGA